MNSTEAQKFFALKDHYETAESVFDDKVIVAIGCNTETPNAWPVDDWEYDSYDVSVTFKDAKPGWDLTPEQRANLWVLGFNRVWIRRTDGSVHYFTKAGHESHS